MQKGLTAEEVDRLTKEGHVNTIRSNTQKSVADIIRENIFTYFNFIFLVLSILIIIAGKFRSLTMTVAVIVNIFIGIFQELRAKKVLDKVAVLNQPTATALRDGEKVTIPTQLLVLSDIIILKSGCQIPADAEVVEGEIDVNESLLTGESDEIHKRQGDKLFSGSFVVSGECFAKLTAVGDDSYISSLTAQAKQMKTHEQSEMVRDINKFVLFAGIAVIPIGIIMYISGIFQGNGFSDSINSMVAAVVGMIPEGLYVLVSVTLALAAASLAGKKVMLHDMKSIETLARVDVLCVDKTGTITGNDMVVSDVLLPVAESEAASVDPALKAGYERMLGTYLSVLIDDNPTMLALRERFKEFDEKEALFTVPFSSRLKYSGVSFDNGFYVLGAPDIILGEEYPMYEKKLSGYMQEGKRVIVFAQADIDDKGNILSKPKPLLFVTIHNPVRENASETFKYFASQGVTIKVISGDNPLTVSNVAKSAGIENAGRYVDMGTVEDERIGDIVSEYTVFGRVKPEQKKRLVEELRKQGHYVAMTGDGVNDIMAMKEADCSVAMATGSDAAVQSSQVVLLDSDFSHMPGIVAEGRRIIGNIERSAILFLTKNVFSMLMALFTIVTFSTYPLLPAQISLVSGLNIGFPAFLLALEPNEKRVTGRFMFKVIQKAIPAAVTDFIMISLMVFIGGMMGMTASDLSVASLVLLGFIGFMLLFIISRPLNKYRVVVLLLSIAGFVLIGLIFHSLFELHAIPMDCTLLTVAACAISVPVMLILIKLTEYVVSRFSLGKRTHTVCRDIEGCSRTRLR